MLDLFSSRALTRGEWVSELHQKVSVKKPNWNLSDMVRVGDHHLKPDVRARDGLVDTFSIWKLEQNFEIPSGKSCTSPGNRIDLRIERP